MKNTLAENMLRFGVKNLNESSERELVIKSIMETINEHGLQSEVRRRLSEQYDPAQTAREFVDAGKGMGTDETGMVTAIKKLKNAQQFYLFAQAIQKLTGTTVGEYFNSEMSAVDRNLYNQIVNHVLRLTNNKVNLTAPYNSINGAIEVIGRSLGGNRQMSI
jgi:hypothetical protein